MECSDIEKHTEIFILHSYDKSKPVEIQFMNHLMAGRSYPFYQVTILVNYLTFINGMKTPNAYNKIDVLRQYIVHTCLHNVSVFAVHSIQSMQRSYLGVFLHICMHVILEGLFEMTHHFGCLTVGSSFIISRPFTIPLFSTFTFLYKYLLIDFSFSLHFFYFLVFHKCAILCYSFLHNEKQTF